MILVIDNYDSFTWNLVQYFAELGARLRVELNDAITVDQVRALNPEAIVVSPGPCAPDQAGISVPAISAFAGSIPILGVCLGHQSIGQAFGARIVRAARIMHGKTSPILHKHAGVFKHAPNPLTATRYHSLLIDPPSLPSCLEVTAWTAEGEIMGVRHKTLDVEGVQFHPESIMTDGGKLLLAAFLDRLPHRGAAPPSPASHSP